MWSDTLIFRVHCDKLKMHITNAKATIKKRNEIKPISQQQRENIYRKTKETTMQNFQPKRKQEELGKGRK